MNQRTQRRPSGIGAYKSELEQIRIWIHNTGRRWFTPSDVNISGQTLKAMAKRNPLKTAGRVGTRQIYEIRSGGWAIA
jgi:hypothetical protein